MIDIRVDIKAPDREKMPIEINEAEIMNQHPTFPEMSNRQADQATNLLGIRSKRKEVIPFLPSAPILAHMPSLFQALIFHPG